MRYVVGITCLTGTAAFKYFVFVVVNVLDLFLCSPRVFCAHPINEMIQTVEYAVRLCMCTGYIFWNKFGNEGRWPVDDITYGINAVHAFVTFPSAIQYLYGCNSNLPRSSGMLVGVIVVLFWSVLWHTGVYVAPPWCGIRILVMSTSHRSGLAPKTSRLIQKAYSHWRILYVINHYIRCNYAHSHVPLSVFMCTVTMILRGKNISTVLRLFIHRSYLQGDCPYKNSF